MFLNYSLNVSQVLASFDVVDLMECAVRCITNSTCLSFNIAIFANATNYACRLLPSDKYNQSSNFAPSQEFHHYTIVVGHTCSKKNCYVIERVLLMK